MTRRVIALLAVVGVLAVGPACAKKNEDKKALQKLLQKSAHQVGVFRYSDQTPSTVLVPGSLAQVRGLIEDDFRYKARLTVDGVDALDEVVNDDALAVRFLDPSFVPKFTSSGGAPDIRAALSARYWVTDTTGAPSIGDAAVADRTIGIDPIVDALSIIDYANDAISAAANVHKFNAERLDYRPAEDPFPRPAPGSGVTRWDLDPPQMPRADALDQGSGGNAGLARAAVFRKMAIYIRDGQIVQIREELSAKFDLLDKFRNYIVDLSEKASKRLGAETKKQLDEIKDQPEVLEAVLNLALNEALSQSGEEKVRFRSMVYEFTGSDQVHADLPVGEDVRYGALDFFGVNSKTEATVARERRVVEGSTTTTPTTSTP